MTSAGGPTVTLTFAGDASKLEQATERVGSSTERMGNQVGSASKRVSESGDGVKRWADRAGDADTRAMGFRDAITGVTDTMQGINDPALTTSERMLLLGTGVGDLASALENLIIPALALFGKTLWTKVIPAVWASTAAFLANPLVWIPLLIAAVIGALVLLVVHWDTVAAAASAAGDWIAARWGELMAWLDGIAADIRAALGSAWDWVLGKAQGMWAWLSGLPGMIGGAVTAAGQWIMDALGSAWDWVLGKGSQFIGWVASIPGHVGSFARSAGAALLSPFRSAFNSVARAWNSTIGRLSWTVPGWVPGFGGSTISVPQIPTFHRGGRVPGVPGQEQLALLQGGETVVPAGSRRGDRGGDGPTVIRFGGNTDSAFANAFMKLVRTGAIQIERA